MMVINNINRCIASMESLTVLIFDSGVGGLSIYQELRFLLPCIYYLYFFDNEVFPYGECSITLILDRVIKVLNIVQKIHRLDLVVIACNTATVLLIEKLRCYFFFPIIGIIPDIQLGINNTRNGIVGLLATYRTINSAFILNIVNRYSINYKILLLSPPELVWIAEKKILDSKKVSISLLCDIMTPWLNILKQPDTIVLGCTHFLHLKNELREVFPKRIYLIGSSREVAYRIVLLLERWGIKNNNKNKYEKKNQAYCSFITRKVLVSWSSVLYNYNFSSLKKISI